MDKAETASYKQAQQPQPCYMRVRIVEFEIVLDPDNKGKQLNIDNKGYQFKIANYSTHKKKTLHSSKIVHQDPHNSSEQPPILRFGQEVLFYAYESTELEMQLIAGDESPPETKGQCTVPIKQMFKMPNMEHLLEVEVVDAIKLRNKQLNVLGILKAQVTILREKIGVLTIKGLCLRTKSNPVVGELKGFSVELEIAGKKYKAEVSERAEDNPSKLSCLIDNASKSQMTIKVIGNLENVEFDPVKVDLLDDNYLIPRSKPSTKEVIISGKNKVIQNEKTVLSLVIEYRFKS